MNPTSSVQQLIVHKPECSAELVYHELLGSRPDCLPPILVSLVEFFEGDLH